MTLPAVAVTIRWVIAWSDALTAVTRTGALAEGEPNDEAEATVSDAAPADRGAATVVEARSIGVGKVSAGTFDRDMSRSPREEVPGR